MVYENPYKIHGVIFHPQKKKIHQPRSSEDRLMEVTIQGVRFEPIVNGGTWGPYKWSKINGFSWSYPTKSPGNKSLNFSGFL